MKGLHFKSVKERWTSEKNNVWITGNNVEKDKIGSISHKKRDKPNGSKS